MNTATIERAEPMQTEVREERMVQPSIDIMELDDRYLIVADVPGTDAEHLKIAVENGTLSIEAAPTLPDSPEGELIYGERGTVRFQRTFELSEDIDAEKIAASLKDGVLRLTLPKLAQRAARKIPVQSG